MWRLGAELGLGMGRATTLIATIVDNYKGAVTASEKDEFEQFFSSGSLGDEVEELKPKPELYTTSSIPSSRCLLR